MEPIKQLSVLLESSTEATIHDTLDYFLRLLYEKLERGAKRRVGSCTVFNTFVNTFRRKLLTLLDDHQQKNGPFYPGGKNGVIGVRKVLQMG